jgi:rhodanese-related sulfurtransferase
LKKDLKGRITMNNLKKLLTMVLVAVMCLNVVVPLNAQNVGDRLGYVLNTDIRVFIDGQQIMGFNIDGYTYVVAEDLRAYGFSVAWDGTARSLTITRGEPTGTPRPVPPNLAPVGSQAFPYLFTDIVTYIGGRRVVSHNVDGQTIIRTNDLAAAFGSYVWDGTARTLSLTLGGGGGITRSGSILISPSELHSLMQEGNPNLVILGVNPGEHTIEGSYTLSQGYYTMIGGPYSVATSVPNLRMPLAETEALFSRAGITANSLVVVYTNVPNQGARLMWELAVLGLEVMYLDGGSAAWAAEGLPTGPATGILDSPVLSDFKAVNYRNNEMNIGIARCVARFAKPR